MVTGVETAGLVLASLPLVIEGLKTYQRGVKTLKRSITYDVSLKKLIRRVNEQKIYLEDNLEKLFSAACPKRDVLQDLGDDYWSKLETGTTGQAVRNYLGEKRQRLFEELLQEFENCLVELANKLDSVQRLDKKQASKVRLTLSDIHSLAISRSHQGKAVSKRVAYLIKEDDVTALTAELDSLNTSMNTLLANVSILHQQKNMQESRIIPDERKAMALSSLFTQIRIYADRLFQAFHSAWVPGCHLSHDVALFLDTPEIPSSRHTMIRASSFKFRVMLTGKPLDVTVSPSWHEASVTVFEDEEPIIPQAKLSAASSSSTQAAVIPSITVTSTAPPHSKVLGHNEVKDLCGAVITARKAQKTLELLLRCGKSLLCSDLSRCRQCNPLANYSTITLEHLLSSQRRISPREKVKLAFKLAISLLQLKTSQWLQVPWSNQAIHFRKLPLVGDTYHIEVDHPLVLQSFCQISQITPPEQPPKATFLELGILLLEIWNEKLFPVFAKENCQIDHVLPMMRQGIANEWYDRTYMDMTKRYGQVVQLCVNWAFEFKPGLQSWDDEDLRKSVCAKIIGPLEEECSTFPAV